MFDRLQAEAGAHVGVRGATLAFGVHAAVLMLGLHSTRGRATAEGPREAPESLLVILDHPRQPGGLPLLLPQFRHGVTGLPDPGKITGLPRLSVPGVPFVPTAPGISPGSGPSEVYDGGSNPLEQYPELLSAPPPRYPDLLRQAGIQGVVIIEAVVDTLGRVERPSLRVIASPHPALSASAEASIATAVFRPGRVDGRAVRVLVQVPVRFTISGP